MPNDDQRAAFVGQWWLPDEPSKRFAGTLDIGQRAELDLYESTDDPRSGSDRDRFNLPILHGRSMGSCLTLLDCTEVGWTSAGGHGEHEDIHRKVVVGTALVGDSHLDSVEECRFNRASLRLNNLDEWVHRSPYKWTTTPTESVEVLDLPTLRASIPGCEILLDRRTSGHMGQLTHFGYTSHEVIELHFAERHALDELEYRFIRPLEQLLTLAAGSRCAALELRVGNEDPSVPWPTNWPRASYAVRRTSSDVAEAGRSVIREHMRFGMNSTGYPPNVDFGSIVQCWYTLQEGLSSVCDLIFSLRSDTAGYLEQQMFTIASAIEGLHRGLNPQLEEKTDEDRARNKRILAAVKTGCPEHHRWLANAIQYAHRPSYAFRVRELLGDIDHLMAAIVGDEEAWTRQLRDIRNGIGHVLRSQDARTFHQVVAMLKSAQLFAEVLLLRQLGFTDTQCRRSIEHHWERQKVRAFVEQGFPQWFHRRPGVGA
jgi:ApeA-like protein/HEPN superfamily Apea-like protein